MDQAQFLQFMGVFERMVQGRDSEARRLGQSKEFLRIEKFTGQQEKFREWSGILKLL